jgi:hypothetical protein
MQTYTLDQFTDLDPTPGPPDPVPTTPVRPCFRVRDWGLERARPGPTMWCDLGGLQAVAGVFDAAKGGPLMPDEIVATANVAPAAADVALSFLLFISAVVRDRADLYRSNTPCVEAEALSRHGMLADVESTDDPEAAGSVPINIPPALARPPQEHP